MSQRGKNWNLPELIQDYQSPDHEDSAPISIRVDTSDSDRPTQPAPTRNSGVEKISSKKLVPEKEPIQDNTVEETRQKYRSEKILATAWISLVLGGGLGSFYMYQTKQGPFAPDEKTTTVETPPKETPEEKPLIIENDEDLKRVLEKENIKATAEDFEFDTGRPALHAKTLRLVVVEEGPNTKPTYKWKPIIPIPGKEHIEEGIKDPQLLVAVQFINPYAQRLLKKVVNPGPGAHRYIARTPDSDDPNIVYFYFDRCTNREQEHALARIRIQDPQDAKSHIWYQSFNIPKCTTKADSVESDEQIQD
ncbi:MAG: hypothetical protein R3B71_04600 [Candidatus Gracilibacteria bacterium]